MFKPIRLIAVLLICAALLPAAGSPFLSASAAPLVATPPPLLLATKSFAVLGASTVTNTGLSTVTGDLGLWPGTSVTGFGGPPNGTVIGTIHPGDAAAALAQTDVTIAYNYLATQEGPCVNLSGQVLGVNVLTLPPGVYCFPGTSAQLTGNLTLDALGDPNAVWVFQIGSTLTTASFSSVTMINLGKSCNVWWQVGSSATLGTGTVFKGNILALDSITVTTGASMFGAALARTGAVTMDNNNIGICFNPTTAIEMREFQATSAAGFPFGLGAGAALLLALGLIVIRRRVLATRSAMPSARQGHGE